MTTPIIVYNYKGDLFQFQFKLGDLKLGDLLEALRIHLKNEKGITGNLSFIINYNQLYNVSDPLTSYVNADGKILVEFDELPPGREVRNSGIKNRLKKGKNRTNKGKKSRTLKKRRNNA